MNELFTETHPFSLDENNETMLRSDKKYGKKDGYNVLPTLLFMGNRAKPDIQRHIVRAIDNLSSNRKFKKETDLSHVYLHYV